MKKKNKTTKTKITNEVSKFPDPKDTKWIPGKINDSKRRDNYKIPEAIIISRGHQLIIQQK